MCSAGIGEFSEKELKEVRKENLSLICVGLGGVEVDWDWLAADAESAWRSF